MNDISLVCKDEKRRQHVRESGSDNGVELNGLDFLEVSTPDQKELRVYLIRKASEKLIEEFAQDDITEHLLVEGGRRITDVKVVEVILKHFKQASKDDYLVITVDKAGDFSNYTLRLIDLENGEPTDRPFPGFDTRYTSLRFNFKSDCPSDLDCKPTAICPPKKFPEPDINYLAKDYASFQQLILDRLAQTMPEWRERLVPDIGITLVDLMAYTGDYLSYFQDAVATEAYLDTARQRISVRRHARLVDYRVHEGCNARAWLHLQLSRVKRLDLDLEKVFFITSFKDGPEPGVILQEEDLEPIPNRQFEVFEPLGENGDEDRDTDGEDGQKIHLYEAHNRIEIYTWGDKDCCLPRGATSATLKDEWADSGQDTISQSEVPEQEADTGSSTEEMPERELHLQVGDFLLFEEVIGPKTGEEEDANPDHRRMVRLTNVKQTVDELNEVPVVEIEWADEDALPFPVCVSTIGPAPKCKHIENISVARGNIILVDHGRRVEEDLDRVMLKETDTSCLREGRPSDMRTIPERFRPQLTEAPLTFSQEQPSAEESAAGLLIQDPREGVPQISLTSSKVEPIIEDELDWKAKSDLLRSRRDDRHFVVEMDDERTAHLRFGDGELGRLPEVGMQFMAHYRIGNGMAGNVGAERIRHVVLRQIQLSGVALEARNPFPAQGGRNPEPVSEVKLFAPTAFRARLERAITTDDYAEIAIRHPKVQKAAATLRWTGSWYEVLVAIDPFGTVESDQELIREIEGHLFRFRRMGHDLKVAIAQFVPLDIIMEICVLPGFLRGHVKAELLQVFSNGTLPDGRLGFFHPDKLTFNQPIRLSNLIATAQAVSGVESVNVTRLERLFEGPNGEIENGILSISPLEIARLDNDPSFPENGRLELKVRGGR